MNIELLEKVKTQILAEPRGFDMHKWVGLDGEHETILGEPCGTVCCIAGWAATLSGFSVAYLNAMLDDAGRDEEPVFSIARAVLQIDHSDANSLFYSGSWPQPFAGDYKSAETPEARARVAVARIDALIHEKGCTPRERQVVPRREVADIPTFALL